MPITMAETATMTMMTTEIFILLARTDSSSGSPVCVGLHHSVWPSLTPVRLTLLLWGL